jgi:hypothetical protein
LVAGSSPAGPTNNFKALGYVCRKRCRPWCCFGNTTGNNLQIPLLGALGLKLAVLPDDEALARIRHGLPPRGTKGPKLGDAELGVGWIGA